MEMGNAFAPVWSVINDDAETLGELLGGRQLAGNKEKVTEEGLVGGSSLSEAGKGVFGDDKDMDGCLRVDVPDGEG